MLTEAAMAGMTDTLLDLKENLLLGHLIPAGTAFNPHLNLKIKRLAQPTPESEDVRPPSLASRMPAEPVGPAV